MSALDDEITALTAKWYRYVGLDHHKDRDCHFYIEKRWSYGDPPKYRAEHNGYIADRWTGPWRVHPETAHLDLVQFLKREIGKAIKYAERDLNDPDEFGWDADPQTRLSILK